QKRATGAWRWRSACGALRGRAPTQGSLAPARGIPMVLRGVESTARIANGPPGGAAAIAGLMMDAMMRPKVFITQPIGPTALARLKTIADVEMVEDSSKIISKERMIEGVKNCDFLLALLHDVVDKDVMDAKPNLRAITSM